MLLDPKLLRQVALFGAVGSEVAVSVVAGCWGGYWLDRHFSTGPLLTATGILLGSALAGWRLWATAHRFEALKSEREKRDFENK